MDPPNTTNLYLRRKATSNQLTLCTTTTIPITPVLPTMPQIIGKLTKRPLLPEGLTPDRIQLYNTPELAVQNFKQHINSIYLERFEDEMFLADFMTIHQNIFAKEEIAGYFQFQEKIKRIWRERIQLEKVHLAVIRAERKRRRIKTINAAKKTGRMFIYRQSPHRS